MKRILKSVTIVWLTAMVTATLAFTSASTASADTLCNAAGYVGPYHLNPGGTIYTYWPNWGPRVAGGTFVQQNQLEPVVTAYTSQVGYQVRSGGFNANSFPVDSAGWGNIIYLC